MTGQDPMTTTTQTDSIQRDSIIRLLCLEFGMIDENGDVINIPTIKKELSYEQLYKHFESISLELSTRMSIMFIEGEQSGLELAKKILRGENDGRTK